MLIKARHGLILLFVCVLLLTGCYKDDSKLTNNSVDNAVITLAAGRHLAPGNKDGFYCSKILEVWEPLITGDEHGNPKPCLAQSWEMTPDGKTWTFYLRKGVIFHDGSRFDADAVLENFKRMEKGIKKSNFYTLDINSFYPGLKEVKKIDAYTIQLIFNVPNFQQLFNMMNFGSAIYGPKCFDENGDFNGIVIGTGPFVIEKNVLNKYVLLVRNEKYYGAIAKTKSIMIKNIPNPEVRYSALKANEIQGVLDLNALPPFLAHEITQDERFAVSTNKSSMIRFLLLNEEKFPFNDVRMRKAISLAIDRPALIESLYLNYAKPTSNILNYTSPFYVEQPIEHNVKEAKALVMEVMNGKRLSARYCINGADILQKGEAELIAFWLSKIGIDITIQSLEYSTLATKLRSGDYEIARSQQGMANGDPYLIFSSFMMPHGSRNISNSIGYKNEEVITLMNKVSNSVSEIERQKIYARIQKISAEDFPIIPLFNDMNIVAYNKCLSGYKAKIYGVTLSEVEVRE